MKVCKELTNIFSEGKGSVELKDGAFEVVHYMIVVQMLNKNTQYNISILKDKMVLILINKCL